MGPPFTFATLEEAFALVDTTIASGEMAQLGFHGVGGDWHSVAMGYFVPLLERLRANLDRLWVTDHISYAKYREKRESASVEVDLADDHQIRLTLRVTTGAELYDQPLTLETRVPAGWSVCRVTQGQRSRDVAVASGGEIVLQRQAEAKTLVENLILWPRRGWAWHIG